MNEELTNDEVEIDLVDLGNQYSKRLYGSVYTAP